MTPIIYNQCIFKPGIQNLTKTLVIRMRQVDSPVLLGRKSKHKTMGKTLVDAFRGIIQAPFEICNFRNFVGKRIKSLLNF